MTKKHAGSCSCGKVTFTVKGELRDVMACHCSQCRKQSGYYYAATAAKSSDLTVKGSENLTWYAASKPAKRGFCATCGSALFWKHEKLDRTSILAGSFDTEIDIKITSHIYCADKGSFYEITDGATQYDGAPPDGPSL